MYPEINAPHPVQPDRSSLPKIRDLPANVGLLITQGISINSSYSTDVKVKKMGPAASRHTHLFSQCIIKSSLLLVVTILVFFFGCFFQVLTTIRPPFYVLGTEKRSGLFTHPTDQDCYAFKLRICFSFNFLCPVSFFESVEICNQLGTK